MSAVARACDEGRTDLMMEYVQGEVITRCRDGVRIELRARRAPEPECSTQHFRSVSPRGDRTYSAINPCWSKRYPWAYLEDVLEKIAGDWPQRELDRLLPDAWAAEHPEALRRSRPA